MIGVFVFALGLTGLSWMQFRFLAPMNTKKEWTVFLSTMILVFAIGTSLVLNLNLPSPLSAIRGVVEPIGRSILH